MFLLVAMGPPGGGRMVISRRLQSRFNLINMTFPAESQIKRIFGSMINQKLQVCSHRITTQMYGFLISPFPASPKTKADLTVAGMS